MTRSRFCTCILAVAIVCRAAIAFSQTVDDVVEKHLAAMGGRAAMQKITSRVTTGTISVSTPGGALSGSIEVYSKAPNKSRTLIKIDASQFGLGQIVQDQRFDGTAGYVIDTMNGNRDLTGDQLEVARANLFPSPLLRYKDAGIMLELLGKENADGRDAYVLRMTPKGGPAARLFIDAETYALSKTVVSVNVPQVGGDIEQSTVLSDYRDVDGVKVPYQVKSINQFQTVSITISKVDQNTAIDDAIFSKPQQ
ncbi:MAG TPA: hypothetical protein VLV86_12260 [Vicinamibacterales bacterium]|nr:hypothetical protein [Vicinamibacterales bacterium]